MRSVVAFRLKDEALDNSNFRKIVYTSPPGKGNRIQVTVMSVKPGKEVGWETHSPTQFFRVEKGNGMAIINGRAFEIKEGDSFVVNSGEEHNVVATTNLKLSSIYFPPEHEDTLER